MWLWLSLTALLCWSGSVSTATNAPEELQRPLFQNRLPGRQ